MSSTEITDRLGEAASAAQAAGEAAEAARAQAAEANVVAQAAQAAQLAVQAEMLQIRRDRSALVTRAHMTRSTTDMEEALQAIADARATFIAEVLASPLGQAFIALRKAKQHAWRLERVQAQAIGELTNRQVAVAVDLLPSENMAGLVEGILEQVAHRLVDDTDRVVRQHIAAFIEGAVDEPLPASLVNPEPAPPAKHTPPGQHGMAQQIPSAPGQPTKGLGLFRGRIEGPPAAAHKDSLLEPQPDTPAPSPDEPATPRKRAMRVTH